MKCENYSQKSDSWSFGLMVHMMLTGMSPWQGTSNSEIEQSILKETRDTTAFEEYLTWFYSTLGLEQEPTDLMMKLLQVNQGARLSMKEALDHPWMTGRGGERRAKRRSTFAPTAEAAFSMVRSLKTFKDEGVLKRTALLALGFSATAEEMDQLSAEFRSVDKDNSGTISFAEFSALILSRSSAANEPALSQYELKSSFDAINQDGTGEIKYSEFIAAAQTQKKHTDNQLKAAFKRLNIAGGDNITAQDLIQMGIPAARAQELTADGMDFGGFKEKLLQSDADAGC